MGLFRRTRSGSDRDTERRQQRLEELRSRLPEAAVSRCEASGEGDQLLHALECLDTIVRNPIFPLRLPLQGRSLGKQGVSVGLVGTIMHPVFGLSAEPQLDALVDTILRESTVGVPSVHDKMLIAFARVSQDGQYWERRRTSSSEEDIAETVGDRILVTVGTQIIDLADLSSFTIAATRQPSAGRRSAWLAPSRPRGPCSQAADASLPQARL
jgi:hypothetical protein